jgi:hypothetical protein
LEGLDKTGNLLAFVRAINRGKVKLKEEVANESGR